MDQLARVRPDIGATVTAPYDDDEDDHSLIIRFPVLSLEARIAVEIARTHRLLLAFHEEAERSLSWNPLSQRSLVAWFEFPQEISGVHPSYWADDLALANMKQRVLA
jgi:hypothetical protein